MGSTNTLPGASGHTATQPAALRGALIGKIHWSAGRVLAAVVLVHVLLWTLLPTLLLKNASLDIIEALAWGHEWQLGYEKDPPLWPWITEAVTQWSGKNLWTCYLASQVCVATVFFAVWRLGRRIGTAREALIGVLLLEGVYYFSYPTPEFNDIVLQMPFAALFGYLLHRGLTDNRIVDWCLAGMVAGLGLLARYSMGAYIIPMALFVLLHPRARQRLAAPGPWLMALVAFVVFLPHALWIVESGFISIHYVARRAPALASNADYFFKLMRFVGAQLAALTPLLAMAGLVWFWRSPKPTAPASGLEKFNRAYLAALAFGPMAFSIALSVATQRPPRAMWGAPLVCFVGLFIAHTLKPVLTADRLRVFSRALVLAMLLPASVFLVEHLLRPHTPGLANRAHFPGRELATQLTDSWNAETGMPLKYVVGDLWHAGNAAFYSRERPSTFFIQGGYRFSPWIDAEKLKASGAVLIWDALEEGHDIPALLAAQFPDAVLQSGLSVHRNSSKYQFGIAFLFPD